MARTCPRKSTYSHRQRAARLMCGAVNSKHIHNYDYEIKDHRFNLGELVQVKDDASKQYHPNNQFEIIGLITITTEELSATHALPINTNLYTVKLQNGDNLEIPVGLLKFALET